MSPSFTSGTPAGAHSPIFIVAPLHRSGTNALADMLLLVPELEMPIITEDHLLEHAGLLLQYATRSAARWTPEKIGAGAGARLQRALGDGLLAFLRGYCTRPDSRMLLKTPRAHGLEYFMDSFPTAKLIVLVRDGRHVVESAARASRHGSHRYWMAQWAEGARLVLDFIHGPARATEGDRWMLVRHEDLMKSPHDVLPSVLAAVGIAESEFDWPGLDRLRGRDGSSHRGHRDAGQGRGARGANDMNWSGWSWWRQLQFKRVAGKELLELGYVSDNEWSRDHPGGSRDNSSAKSVAPARRR